MQHAVILATPNALSRPLVTDGQPLLKMKPNNWLWGFQN